MFVSRVRGPGKTFSFAQKLIKDYDKKGNKFVLFTRTQSEVGSVAAGILNGYLQVADPSAVITEKRRMGGKYSLIYRERGYEDDKEIENIGYVIAINAADKIKLVSSQFVDATQACFDEFQPDHSSTYLQDEVGKFLTIHTSLARGGGESRRYFPVYMASNTISIANPYFVELGLTSKIQSNTKFYRGSGYVYERCEIEGLAQKHAETGMSKAFAKQDVLDFGDNSWLNDNETCVVSAPGDWGKGIYIATLKDKTRSYAVKYYPQVGLYYLDYAVDRSCKYVYNLTVDGDLNIPLIRSGAIFQQLRRYFQMGQVRFKNQQLKNVVLSLFVPKNQL